MNFIGKGLVVVHTLFSLAGLLLAVVIYFEFVDWGRAEPRVAAGEPLAKGGSNDQRVPSEYDKNVVIFNDAVIGRNLAIPGMKPAEARLLEAEQHFAQNDLAYAAELRKLRTDPGEFQVNAIPADGVPTDTPGKSIGKPIPSVPVEGLTKSLRTYKGELERELEKLEPLGVEIRAWAKKNQEISYQLTGKDENGKKVTHGLFGLIDQEFKNQQLLKEERDYLQPQWAYTVAAASRFGARRAGLEETLAGLKKALDAREKQRK